MIFLKSCELLACACGLNGGWSGESFSLCFH